MTVPSVVTGRGAWSKIGKDNGSRVYVAKNPRDGLRPTVNVNYQAVHLGVKAIQTRANEYAKYYGRNPAKVDGDYSPIDRELIKFVQQKLGFTGSDVDGIVGPVTAKAMFRDLVTWFAAVHNVPASHIWGMTSLESGFDPGAVGYLTPSDRGLCQINLIAHPNISVEQAFDPKFALNYTANRLRQARDQFSGKGPELQKVCSIAQHNSPLAARQWYEIGWVGPNEKIAKYVELVLIQAGTY